MKLIKKYLKAGKVTFNPNLWSFDKIDKSKLTQLLIDYAVNNYFFLKGHDSKYENEFLKWYNLKNRIGTTNSNQTAEAKLPELTVTATKPVETTSAKDYLTNNFKSNVGQVKDKWDAIPTEDKVHGAIDAAITLGGFIPGVDTFADGADVLHSLYKGDYTGAGIGAAAMVIPGVSAAVLRRTLPKIKGVVNSVIHPVKTAKIKQLAKEFDLLIDATDLPISEIPAGRTADLPTSNGVGSTYLGLIERPKSSITDAERAGVPKGERNLPPREWLEGERTLKPDGSTKYYHWSETLRFTEPESELYKRNLIEPVFHESHITPAMREDGFRLIFPNAAAPEGNLKSTLDNIIASRAQHQDGFTHRFLDSVMNDGEVLSGMRPYFDEFRHYYRSLGIDLSGYSNLDIAKILDNQYDYLTSMQRGKAKGKLFWHGSMDYFDSFDPSFIGKNTGAGGVTHHDGFKGMYFSGQPIFYGGMRNSQDEYNYIIRAIGGRYPLENVARVRRTLNSQPYLFDRVGHVVQETDRYDRELAEGVLGIQKNRMPGIVDGPEFVVNSQRVSSLYPHPETANGQWFVRSFDNPRFNYKKGGKLIKNNEN